MLHLNTSADPRGRPCPGGAQRAAVLIVAIAIASFGCGGKAVIDVTDEAVEPVCFDAVSCCEAATTLFDERCPRSDGQARSCPIASVPGSCEPFLGEVYRCIWENPDAIFCDGDAAQLACGTCEAELEAAGEPCGQSMTCAP